MTQVVVILDEETLNNHEIYPDDLSDAEIKIAIMENLSEILNAENVDAYGSVEETLSNIGFASFSTRKFYATLEVKDIGEIKANPVLKPIKGKK